MPSFVDRADGFCARLQQPMPKKLRNHYSTIRRCRSTSCLIGACSVGDKLSDKSCIPRSKGGNQLVEIRTLTYAVISSVVINENIALQIAEARCDIIAERAESDGIVFKIVIAIAVDYHARATDDIFIA